LAFVGVLVAQFITRQGATELETRSKREETMRNLRWAAALSVSTDNRLADLGVAQLVVLLNSNLLDDSEKVFVEAALDAVYENAETAIDQVGEDAEVIQLVAMDDVRLTQYVDADVPLDEEVDGGDEDDG